MGPLLYTWSCHWPKCHYAAAHDCTIFLHSRWGNEAHSIQNLTTYKVVEQELNLGLLDCKIHAKIQDRVFSWASARVSIFITKLWRKKGAQCAALSLGYDGSLLSASFSPLYPPTFLCKFDLMFWWNNILWK